MEQQMRMGCELPLMNWVFLDLMHHHIKCTQQRILVGWGGTVMTGPDHWHCWVHNSPAAVTSHLALICHYFLDRKASYPKNRRASCMVTMPLTFFHLRGSTNSFLPELIMEADESVSTWQSGDFSGGPVVKTPCFNAGGVGPIPGWGTGVHRPWSMANKICILKNDHFCLT